jgi:hypothetical protein
MHYPEVIAEFLGITQCDRITTKYNAFLSKLNIGLVSKKRKHVPVYNEIGLRIYCRPEPAINYIKA